MAARLPVVATPAGDVATVIVDGVTGSLVPFDDEDAMTERMVTFARSSTLRAEMGEAGRRRVESTYQPSALGDRLHSVYLRTLARHRTGTSTWREVPSAIDDLSKGTLKP
jgi:glycosyltransferase involved in cell wall biosynthesis